MRKIALIGSQQLSERLINYFESTGFGKTVGLFDDYETEGELKLGYPILGGIKAIPLLFKKGAFDEVAIGVGYAHMRFRESVFQFLCQNRIPITTFIHPTTYVDKSAHIGIGAIILVSCVVEMKACVEDNVFISSQTFISHHVLVGAHSYLGPAIKLAGGTTVGKRCFLGISTTSIDGIQIGNDVRVAAGAVITRNVPPECLIAGVPAEVKRHFATEGEIT